MKYSPKEFVDIIRKRYPRDYKDWSDQELFEIWMKKNPNDYSKIVFDTKKKSNDEFNFSFGGLIATLIFGYFTYQMYTVAEATSRFNDFLQDESLISKFFKHLLNGLSEGKFSEVIEDFNFYIYVVFISYLIKTIVSGSHIIDKSINSIIIVSLITVVFEFLPIFLYYWNEASFEDAMPTLIVLIPSIIPTLFLLTSDLLENDN